MNFGDDGFLPDEVRPGRRSRYRFTQTPQWALLWADLTDAGYRVYSLLLAHVNAERGDALVWPTQTSLAAMLGKHANTISRIVTKELSRLGLVDVEVVRYGPNKTRRRNVYTVHEVPPADWEGWASLQEWYAAYRDESSNTAGQPGPTKNVGSGPTKNEGSGPTKNGVENYTKAQLDEEENDPAPSARSAGGVRSTSSSGSSARDGGGSAATEQPASPSKPTKLSAPQRKAVLAVESVLPPVLLAALPYGHIPNRNRPTVLAALESRTVGQLAERVRRRWTSYGYEAAFHSGEIGSLVGAALELLAPTPHCPDLSCEDGWMVDTGEQCRACVQRRADRRAARARGETPAGGTGADRHECVDCGRPFPGAVPDDGLCRSCAVTPTAAMEALLARWAAEDAAAQQAEDLFAEADRRRKQRAADRPTTPQHGTAPF
ncbi:hypothetical protein ACPCUF_00755 [Streptomyces griseoincarnatus]